MASNFQQQSQSGLNKHFTTLSICLSNLDKMKDNFAEVKVPANVFKYFYCFFNKVYLLNLL